MDSADWLGKNDVGEVCVSGRDFGEVNLSNWGLKQIGSEGLGDSAEGYLAVGKRMTWWAGSAEERDGLHGSFQRDARSLGGLHKPKARNNT
jgi:hypothetical protein